MVAYTKENWEVCVQERLNRCVHVKRKMQTNWFSLPWDKDLKRQYTAWENKFFFSPDNNISVVFLIIKFSLLRKLGQSLPLWIKSTMLVWNKMWRLTEDQKESLEVEVLQFSSFPFPCVLQHWFLSSQPCKRYFQGTIWNVVFIFSIENARSEKSFFSWLSSLDSLNQASFILISSTEESLKLQKGDRKNQPKKKPKKGSIFLELTLPVLPRFSFLTFLYDDWVSLPTDTHKKKSTLAFPLYQNH